MKMKWETGLGGYLIFFFFDLYLFKYRILALMGTFNSASNPAFSNSFFVCLFFNSFNKMTPAKQNKSCGT